MKKYDIVLKFLSRTYSFDCDKFYNENNSVIYPYDLCKEIINIFSLGEGLSKLLISKWLILCGVDLEVIGNINWCKNDSLFDIGYIYAPYVPLQVRQVNFEINVTQDISLERYVNTATDITGRYNTFTVSNINL